MSDLLGLILLVVFALVLLGAYLYYRWKYAQYKKTWPTTWVHKGLAPPPGVDKALQVIAEATPGMPQCGYIEWVKDPFFVGEILAAGTVDYEPIRIKVMYNDLVERTALAHEAGHAWNHYTKQGFGESPQDKRFVQWFTDVNTKIRKALGR